MTRRWAFVSVATGFNLALEYSMRGLNDIPVHPFIPPFLFLTYFTYFTMLDDLTLRFRLRDGQLMTASFIYGTMGTCLFSGRAFTPPLILGVNWGALLFINLVWWGAVQAVLTFYLAGRLFPREWDARPLPLWGWGVLLPVQGLVVLVFQSVPAIPKGTPIGYTMMLLIMAGGGFALWRSIQAPRDVPPHERHAFLDGLSIATLGIFLFSAVILTSDPAEFDGTFVNQTARLVVMVWSAIVAGLLLIHRMVARRPIPV